MHEVTEEFSRCWQAAGQHLQAQTHDGQLSWLKANLVPPFLEHLSFRLGNQLFFIRIDDVDGKIRGPGNPNGFRIIAKGCSGHTCRMPMRFNGSNWETAECGWGLIDDQSGRVIDPIALISDEKIEMTNWELHDFSVQVVRDYIEQELGRQIMSSQGNPAVDPSIWFVGEDGPEWVVVRAAKFPKKESSPPTNMADIAVDCAKLSNTGHFASVAVANSEAAFDSTGNVPVLPLLRGHGMYVRFDSLQKFSPSGLT